MKVTNGNSVKIVFTGNSTKFEKGRLSFCFPSLVTPRVQVGLHVPLLIPVRFENIGLQEIEFSFEGKDIREKYPEDVHDNIIKFKKENGIIKPKEKRDLMIYIYPKEEKVYKYSFKLEAKTRVLKCII